MNTRPYNSRGHTLISPAVPRSDEDRRRTGMTTATNHFPLTVYDSTHTVSYPPVPIERLAYRHNINNDVQVPAMHVNYHNTKVKITLVTGAHQNFIRQDVARELRAPITRLSVAASKDTTYSNITGETIITFKRGPLLFTFQGLVVSDLHVEVIAGLPFMEDNDVSLHPAHGKIYFCDGSSHSYEASSPRVHQPVQRVIQLQTPPNTDKNNPPATTYPGPEEDYSPYDSDSSEDGTMSCESSSEDESASYHAGADGNVPHRPMTPNAEVMRRHTTKEPEERGPHGDMGHLPNRPTIGVTPPPSHWIPGEMMQPSDEMRLPDPLNLEDETSPTGLAGPGKERKLPSPPKPTITQPPCTSTTDTTMEDPPNHSILEEVTRPPDLSNPEDEIRQSDPSDAEDGSKLANLALPGEERKLLCSSDTMDVSTSPLTLSITGTHSRQCPSARQLQRSAAKLAYPDTYPYEGFPRVGVG